MKTINLNLYSFEELSEEAKRNAFEEAPLKEAEIDFFTEDCMEQIKNEGWEDVELRYSLSYSQGDGLSFEGILSKDKLKEFFVDELGENKSKTINILLENIEVKSDGNQGRYYFSRKYQVVYNFTGGSVRDNKNITSLLDRVIVKIQESYMALCKKLENEGYKNFEYQCSYEYFLENNHEEELYLENGKLYN